MRCVGGYPKAFPKPRQQTASRNATYSSYLAIVWKEGFFERGVNTALVPSGAVRNHGNFSGTADGRMENNGAQIADS